MVTSLSRSPKCGTASILSIILSILSLILSEGLFFLHVQIPKCKSNMELTMRNSFLNFLMGRGGSRAGDVSLYS